MINVFKFGGASVKDASAVRNVANIIQQTTGSTYLLIVVSAMGKTTNAFEKVLNAFWLNENYQLILEEIKLYHEQIIDELFKDSEWIKNQINIEFNDIISQLKKVVVSTNRDQLYDQVVSKGEIISSIIIHHYLQNEKKINCEWIDARNYIKTDQTWREGNIDWEKSSDLIKKQIKPILEKSIILTQGFIGQTPFQETTTLGREGSDYTAAIFAHILDAEAVTIWKDVPGVLNADPKLISNAILFEKLSYSEAAEMTYYGATVIHPKTIRPLAAKNIPLYVRSFIDFTKTGTKISEKESEVTHPVIIFKKEQILISFGIKDLDFISEDNLSKIFYELATHNIKINMMQNSALSFSVCIDKTDQIKKVMNALENIFTSKLNEDLILITIRNYNNDIINELVKDKNSILEQKTRYTIQLLIKN